MEETGTANGGPAQEDIPESVAPPPRDRTLTPAEIAVESTRLVVGLAALIGSGFVTLLERYGVPNEELHPGGATPPPAVPGGDPTAADVVRAVFLSALGLVRTPAGSAAPRRNVLAGLAFDLPGIGRSVRDATRRRAAPLLGVAARVSTYGPLAARVDRTQAVLERWQAVGSAEMAANRQYAAAVLDAGARLGMDWIVDNLNLDLIIQNLDLNRLLSDLELTDVIMESTGGVTERTLESVRSQAVGADGLVEQIVARVLRRDPARFPKGPPALTDIREAHGEEDGDGDGPASSEPNGSKPRT